MPGRFATKNNAIAMTMTLLLAGCGAPPAPPATAPAPQAPVQTTAPSTAPANAAADSAIDDQIKNVLGGDPKAYHDVFDRLQKAMAAGDKAAVAALVSYPLDAKVDGNPIKIANAQDFVANWDQIVTPQIAKAVADQQFASVMVNQNGLMIGSGEVWISGVCDDTACKNSRVLITAIQNGPQ